MFKHQAIKNSTAFQEEVAKLAEKYGLYLYTITGFIGDPGDKAGYPVTIFSSQTEELANSQHGRLIKSLSRTNGNIMVQYSDKSIIYEREGDKITHPDAN